MKKADWIWLLARLFAGTVFFYAGLTKLLDPIENFRGAVAQYQVFPYAVVPLIAYTLPWIELIAGAFLILGYAIPAASWVVAGLSLGFLLVLGASSLITDAGAVDCGCFGEGSLIHLTVHQVFLLDLLNFFIALRLRALPSPILSLDHYLKQGKTPPKAV